MTIDASKLQVSLEEGERCRRRLSVTVPADAVRVEREEIAHGLAQRLKLPGFRKGRVPAAVVEKRYGPVLQRETLDKVIGAAYRQVLQRESLQPISEGEVEDVDYRPDGDLTFSISFDVQPDVRLERLGGFRVERPPLAVGDTEVEEVLDRLREQQAAWKPAPEGPVEDGDLVAVEIVRLEEGEEASEARPYEFVIGRGEAIPDVEAAIRTLSPGETEEFNVVFPEDFPDESRRGEAQRLRITLQSRKVQELPELDDDFARSLGDFEALDDLRSKVREDLEREASDRQEGSVRGRLLDLLVEANPFPVPDSMVDRYLQSFLGDTQGVDPEKLERAREQLRPEAERAVRRALVVDRVAETQSLAASAEEVDERIQEIADRNDATPAQVYGRLQKAGRIEVLEREITEEKVFDFLKSRSEIVDAPAE